MEAANFFFFFNFERYIKCQLIHKKIFEGEIKVGGANFLIDEKLQNKFPYF